MSALKQCVKEAIKGHQKSCRIVGEAWSSCSESCGSGTRNRTRKCDNPEPQHGGEVCVGDAVETEACYNGPCLSKYLNTFSLHECFSIMEIHQG